eukprot:TRINITY_DN3912_c0_g1_i1.p1 TRINITY_DN3912_c0_g1~~TRINITY_DN3912_c0_g1_i1.p1  ORF type:complete len:207 (+),score=43.38 TRINITY_DN3912_c0_g1_i1:92-622(+)
MASTAFPLSIAVFRCKLGTVASRDGGSVASQDIQGLTNGALCLPLKSHKLGTTAAGGHLSEGRRALRSSHVVRAEYRRDSGASDFVSGFLLGGLLFGALGFLFAPQLSRTILGENGDGTIRRLPRWMEEEDNSLEASRQKMIEKLAELNAAIDETYAQLRAEDGLRNSRGEGSESA